MNETAVRKEWLEGSDFPIRLASHFGEAPAVPDRCYHRALELTLILRGEGAFFIHDGLYNFKRRSVLFVGADEIHNYVSGTGSGFDAFHLMFLPAMLGNGTAAPDLVNRVYSRHHVLLTDSQAATAEAYIREIDSELKSMDVGWQSAARNHLENLLIVIDRAMAGRQADKEQDDDPLIRDIIAYIDAHLREKLTLHRVATRAGLSPCFFSRVFKAHVGLGFKQYLIQRRIAEARRLMIDSPLKLEAIARKVGFSDYSTFKRNFKIQTGNSPSLYRKIST